MKTTREKQRIEQKNAVSSSQQNQQQSVDGSTVALWQRYKNRAIYECHESQNSCYFEEGYENLKSFPEEG